MKILKRFFITGFALVALALTANAEEWIWTNLCPDQYLPAMNKQIISRNSSVNQGEEAFMDFIAKFRTNKTFRDSRIKYFGTDENMKEAFYSFVDYSNEYGMNWYSFKTMRKNTRCDKSWASWNIVSPDEIGYRSKAVLPCDEDGDGSTGMYRFQRIDGKWYLTDICIVG